MLVNGTGAATMRLAFDFLQKDVAPRYRPPAPVTASVEAAPHGRPLAASARPAVGRFRRYAAPISAFFTAVAALAAVGATLLSWQASKSNQATIMDAINAATEKATAISRDVGSGLDGIIYAVGLLSGGSETRLELAFTHADHSESRGISDDDTNPFTVEDLRQETLSVKYSATHLGDLPLTVGMLSACIASEPNCKVKPLRTTIRLGCRAKDCSQDEMEIAAVLKALLKPVLEEKTPPLDAKVWVRLDARSIP